MSKFIMLEPGNHELDITRSENYIVFAYNYSGRTNINLRANHARINFYCINICRNKKYNMQIIQNHKHKNSYSQVRVFSVLLDRSDLTCESLLKVEKNAAKACAYFENFNLILSPTASAAFRPYMKVLNSDADAKHSSYSGNILEDKLYYFRARGLSSAQAREKLIMGYLSDFLREIPASQKKGQASLKNKINRVLKQCLI
jgi:Fe-S cluster assembly protein SufD